MKLIGKLTAYNEDTGELTINLLTINPDILHEIEEAINKDKNAEIKIDFKKENEKKMKTYAQQKKYYAMLTHILKVEGSPWNSLYLKSFDQDIRQDCFPKRTFSLSGKKEIPLMRELSVQDMSYVIQYIDESYQDSLAKDIIVERKESDLIEIT